MNLKTMIWNDPFIDELEQLDERQLKRVRESPLLKIL